MIGERKSPVEYKSFYLNKLNNTMEIKEMI